MKFSVITVCKNCPDIEKTCKSIVAQSFRDFEWIVIDGASNDNTLEILEKYRADMARFVSEPDCGIYNAMNKGIGLAHGKYLIFLNGGDTFHDNFVLEKFIGDKDILYANALEVGEGNEICTMPDKIDADFLIYSRLMHPSTAIKRTLFDIFGTYDEDLKITADHEKFIVFYKNGATFEKVDMIAADFALGGLSSSKKFKRQHQIERANVLKKHFTKKEIENCYKKFPPKFIERLYSLKNEGTCKVLRLFFLKFRIDFRFLR